MKVNLRTWSSLAVSLAAILAASASAEESNSTLIARGREIFFHGTSGSATKITASLGERGDTVDASLVPCAHCHGEDGHGHAEGGVQPADITPAHLHRSATLGTRTREAYTRARLTRAITMGFDASGNALDRAMPRFALSREDAEALLDYLDVLGAQPPPGVSDDAIRINLLGADDFDIAPTTIYGRRLLIGHERRANALLTIDAYADGSASVLAADADRMPTLAVRAAHAAPGATAFVLTASTQDQIAALRAQMSDAGGNQVVFAHDCNGIAERSDELVLMTSEATANCNLDSIPLALDRRIRIAAATPPAMLSGSASARAAFAIVTSVLAAVGRDVTRATLIAALEHVDRAQVPGLAAVTWTADRHFGTSDAWLMTLDVRKQELIGEPGWTRSQP